VVTARSAVLVAARRGGYAFAKAAMEVALVARPRLVRDSGQGLARTQPLTGGVDAQIEQVGVGCEARGSAHGAYQSLGRDARRSGVTASKPAFALRQTLGS